MTEIILAILIFILCFILIRVNFISSLVLALVLSVFLHKELFSLFIWDLLPIRLFMLAFLVNSSYEFLRFNGLSLKFTKYLKDPLVFLLILFVLTKIISTFNSQDLRTSFLLNIFYISVINFVLTIYFKLKEQEIFGLYKNYIFIAFLIALIPFLQIYLYFNNNYLFGAILNVAGVNVDFPSFEFSYQYFMDALKLIVMTRLGSIFWDVNHFGGFLAGLFIPTLALFLISRGKEQKNFLFYFIFISLGLFLTNSRSAWLIGFVALVVFLILIAYRKVGKKGVIYTLIAFGILTILSITLYQDRDSLFREKVRSYLHYRMDSFDSHFLLLQGAIDVFNKYPLIGGGTGSFFEHFKETPTSNEFLKRDPAGLSGRVPAHSIWGEVIAESGALGLFVFVGLVGLVVGIFIYALFHTSKWQDYFIYSSFLASSLGWLVAGIFYSYNSEFFFILFFFPIIYTLKKENIIFEELFHYFKFKNYYLKFLVALISLSLLTFSLGSTKLITFDESIYAKVAKNMFETGDIFTLTWRNYSDLWFEKPPLYFIVTSYLYSLLGVSEFSTRIGVVLFSIFGLIYTYKLAKLIFGSSYVGVFAVFGLIINTSYLYYSRIGMLDVILTSFIVSSTFYFLKYSNSKKRIDLIISGILIGLGVLTKSLIGFMPLVIFGVYFLLDRFVLRNKSYSFLDLFFVGVSALLVSMPWHIQMYLLHGNKFIDSYFGYHLFERFSTEIEDKGAPWYFYFVVLRNTMRVWFLILLPALGFFFYQFFKRKIPSNSSILLISSIVIMTLFASSSSKLKWYIMPIYPFLYIVCAYFVFNLFNFLIIKKVKYQVIGLLLYLFFFLNLTYLYSIRSMVYTSDFNLKQASLLIKNNSLPNVDMTYIDKIDYPIALFYNEKPNFEITQFSILKEILPEKVNDAASITIITGKNRFESLKRIIPSLQIIEENDDFVLSSLNYPLN